jgi:hypothetical protein
LREISTFLSDLALQVSARLDMFRKDIDCHFGAKAEMLAVLAYVGQGFCCAHYLFTGYVDLDVHLH